MKKTFMLSFGLFIAILIINTATVSGQAYSNLDLQIIPSYVSVCPCVPITPKFVRIAVKNLGAEPVVPEFELLNVPAGWTGQIQPHLDKSLAPGEEGTVSLLLINPPGCDVEPGTYTVTVKTTGLTAGDTVSRDLQIEIMQCYGVELDVSEDYKETCRETGKKVIYPVTVKNLGKNPDTIDLDTSVAWASFSESSVTVGPGEMKTVELILNPPTGLTGLQTISVTATSCVSPSIYDAKEVKLKINECYSFDASLTPQEKTLCLGESADYKLLLRNTGSYHDVYNIYGPDWVTISENNISLSPGESREITITATPEEMCRIALDLTVSSLNDPESTKIVSGFVNVNECGGVAVVTSPSEGVVCQGKSAEFNISIKNIGKLEGTFDLSASMGALSQNKVVLSPGNTKDLSLIVDTTELGVGEYTLSVTASEGQISDTGEFKLVVRDCYDATLEIVPTNMEKCVCEIAGYEIFLKNTGEMPDTYDIGLESDVYNHETDITLSPGEETRIPIDIPTLGLAPGEYVLTATAESDYVSLSANATLRIKSFESCYSIIIESDKNTIVIKACSAPVLPMVIKNEGEVDDIVDIAHDGPEWIYVSPDSFNLQSGEEKTAYLYISPSFEISEGSYTATVSATSRHTKAEMKVNITVIPAGNGTVPTNISGIVPDNQTATNQTGANITINISTITGTNITGMVTADEEGPLWKTAVVAIITIIIVVILVVRFALLLKK